MRQILVEVLAYFFAWSLQRLSSFSNVLEKVGKTYTNYLQSSSSTQNQQFIIEPTHIILSSCLRNASLKSYNTFAVQTRGKISIQTDDRRGDR